MNCQQHPLSPAKIVAVATDSYLKPTKHDLFTDPQLPGSVSLRFGLEFTFGTGRTAPDGHDVGKTEADLKPKMEKLLTIFAGQDKSGMAKRLFDQFLAKQPKVIFFEDAALNTAAAGHANIKFFCNAALSAPNSPQKSPGKTRIHQALEAAGWDIGKMKAPTDLGVPAFNEGSKVRSTGDFGNGLGVMINGVQYAYVVATHYHHDAKAKKYCISLKYIFYDVFGLDDDDLTEFGAKSDSLLSSNAAIGITAWWQLQHQHGYAPLVTRVVVEKTFEVPT